MNKDEFHISFIKNLIFIGIVTIITMASSRFFMLNYMINTNKTLEYATQNSQFEPK